MRIPLECLERANKPFEREFSAAFSRVLHSGRYVLSEEVAAFEGEFSAKYELPYALGVASGYDALTLAFWSLNVTRGEVIIPANTYMATVLSVLRLGLTPVLCEPDPETLLFSAENAEKLITRETVALLPVHLYGLMCDMDAVNNLATAHSLLVVEDCAQGVGASFRGRFAGNLGHAAGFSFYPTKNLGALGDGGLTALRWESCAARLKALRNYGAKTRAVADEVGLNSRLDEVQAAILRVKLNHIDEINEKKNALARRYDEGLDPSFIRPREVPGTAPARCLYVVAHPRRDGLREFLAGRGVATDVHYPVPLHRQRAIAPYTCGDYPVATRLCATLASLPLSHGNTVEEIDEVIAAANEFAKSV